MLSLVVGFQESFPSNWLRFAPLLPWHPLQRKLLLRPKAPAARLVWIGQRAECKQRLHARINARSGMMLPANGILPVPFGAPVRGL